MKKIIFFTVITLFGNVLISAQGVAERFRLFTMSFGAQATTVVAMRFGTTETSLPPAPIPNEDEPAVRALINTLETGWNNKSGATFSSVFADVHDYIVVNGMYFSNWTRKGNEAAHQGLFNGMYKNFNIQLKVDKITLLRLDLVQVIVIGGGYEKGGALPENPGIIMTILAEKKTDSWKIISFHNHNLEPDIKERSPMPLTVMYASWYKK